MHRESGLPEPACAAATLLTVGFERGGRAGLTTSVARAFLQTFPVLLACSKLPGVQAGTQLVKDSGVPSCSCTRALFSCGGLNC